MAYGPQQVNLDDDRPIDHIVVKLMEQAVDGILGAPASLIAEGDKERGHNGVQVVVRLRKPIWLTKALNARECSAIEALYHRAGWREVHVSHPDKTSLDVTVVFT